MEAADEGPDPAVMILVGQVEVAAAVILAPIRIARVDRWVDCLARRGVRHAHLVEIAHDVIGPVLVGQAGQHCQKVAQGIAVVAKLAKRDVRQIEWAAGDSAHVVIEHVPFQAHRFEPLQVFGEVRRNPTAIDPHEQVDPLEHIGAAVVSKSQILRGRTKRRLA